MTREHTIAKTQHVIPITIGAFTLASNGLEVRGRPTFDEYQGVGDFIKRAHRASGWWLADWLRYGEERQDWREVLSQAVDATGLSEKTLRNVRAIGAIPPSRRRDGVEFTLHAAVIGLDPEAQNHWLARAEEEGWTRQELRNEILAAKRPKMIEGQAVLKGRYRVIYADPPWLADDGEATKTGSTGSKARHPPGVTVDELCSLPVQAHATERSVLFLWVPVPMLYRNPGPREVIEAWGFTPVTGIVWDKVLGDRELHGVRVRHEHLIVATRGSCPPDAPSLMPDSVQAIRSTNDHGDKPVDFRRLIERLYTRGPRLDLFARKQTPGWGCFGGDPHLWAQEAERSA